MNLDEYDYSYKSEKKYDYPINGGLVERVSWQEKQERRAWHENYPINRGKLERLAWERAHGWDR